ncbi:MAG: hypothetical protein ACE14V_13515 [bacterium]
MNTYFLPKFILLLILCSLLFNSFTANAESTIPVIQNINGKHVVYLPPAMKNALLNYDSTFKPWDQDDYLPSLISFYTFTSTQAPFAVIGDFNGDTTIDIILQGHTSNNSILLAIFSNYKGYKILELAKSMLINPKEEWYGIGNNQKEYGFWVYLTLVSPGRIKSPYEKKGLYLKTHAFQIVAFEKAAVLYYYKKGEFIAYITAD